MLLLLGLSWSLLSPHGDICVPPAETVLSTDLCDDKNVPFFHMTLKRPFPLAEPAGICVYFLHKSHSI